MSPNLIKQARLAIQDLYSELEHTKQAQELAFKLYKRGVIVAEDLEEKIAEFSNKTKEDLVVFEKAAELVNDPKYSLGLGSLSDRFQDNGTYDRLTKMLIEDSDL